MHVQADQNTAILRRHAPDALKATDRYVSHSGAHVAIKDDPSKLPYSLFSEGG